jgi:hypothetical protein
LSILFGIAFHFASAKWVRLAWEQPVSFFRIPASDSVVEKVLEVSFWGTIIALGIGIGLIVWFVVTYSCRGTPKFTHLRTPKFAHLAP